MREILTLLLILSFFCGRSQIPFEQYPSFETNPSGHVATGLGIADINGDGWKDIIVANGNDISRQRLVVYYNNGDGTFPSDPSWESSDIDYHGHLSAGDIDNDGDVDIAVSVYLGAGGFGNQGRVKLYYNQGNELEALPSFESEAFYSFSCALGDADADGDLDIAVACGEPYNEVFQPVRIFLNNNGNFNTTAEWQSDITMCALDVEFGDLDQNGFLDLVFICEYSPNYVFLADNTGQIDTEWDWVSDHPDNFMNSVDLGRSCLSTNPGIVVTGNNQLGGDGKIKQFVFDPPIPSSSGPSWASGYVGNGSGILLAEINNDYKLDLLYGSWWGPLCILEGDCDVWDPVPAYTADETSVVEAILMSDLGKFNYTDSSKTIKSINAHSAITLDQQVIEQINNVFINGIPVPRSDYCYVELRNWVSFKENLMPGDVVTIEYDYMKNGDIVISNWDSDKGNFIYYNMNNPVGVDENTTGNDHLIISRLYPDPAADHLNITLGGNHPGRIHMEVFNLHGQLVHTASFSQKNHLGLDVSSFPAGVYMVKLSGRETTVAAQFIVAR